MTEKKIDTEVRQILGNVRELDKTKKIINLLDKTLSRQKRKMERKINGIDIKDVINASYLPPNDDVEKGAWGMRNWILEAIEGI